MTELQRCPACGMAKRLRERITENNIYHNCVSCGYTQVWTPRMSKLELQQRNAERPNYGDPETRTVNTV